MTDLLKKPLSICQSGKCISGNSLSPLWAQNRVIGGALQMLLTEDRLCVKTSVGISQHTKSGFTLHPQKALFHFWLINFSGCSLGIGEWRSLRLLRWILQLTLGSLWLFFSSDVEPLSKYSPVTPRFSIATRILNENPAFWPSWQEFFLLL